MQGEAFFLSSIPFGTDPLAAEVRTVQPSAYWAAVELSDPRHHALLAAAAGDDWSGSGIPNVGHAKMADFLRSNPNVTSPKEVRHANKPPARLAAPPALHPPSLPHPPCTHKPWPSLHPCRCCPLVHPLCFCRSAACAALHSRLPAALPPCLHRCKRFKFRRSHLPLPHLQRRCAPIRPAAPLPQLQALQVDALPPAASTSAAPLRTHPPCCPPLPMPQLFESEEFLEDVLRGQYPEPDVVDAVCRSWIRHLFVATPSIFNNTWVPLNPLPAGVSVPNSTTASSRTDLCGWDSLLPWPRGRRSKSACKHIINLVCAALDVPFANLPQGDHLRDVLAGACFGQQCFASAMWAGRWPRGAGRSIHWSGHACCLLLLSLANPAVFLLHVSCSCRRAAP